MKKSKVKRQNTSQVIHWSAFSLASLMIAGFLVSEINRTYYHPVSDINFAKAAAVATLSLSPANTTVANNQTFTVNILLNTSGSPTDGVDILSLHFNPSILQVVDDNTSVSGIQIAAGSLLPITVINTASNSTGVIQFSQASSGGSNFTGSGTLATIQFRGIANGTSAVTFDFTAGSTTDTNVAYQGLDQLASVTNASYIVDASAPTVSISAPNTGATVSGTTTISASASDNIGVVGVQFRLNGANLGAEDTSSPFSTSWNTTASSNGSYTLSAVARDGVGNTTTSSNISVTVNNADTTPPTVSMTAPSNGASVNGTITVSANASDNIGVVGVQFRLNGANLNAEDTTSAYSTSWNTTSVGNGSHTLTAVARDAAGNTATAASVNVTVNNPDTTSPSVSITTPNSGSTATGSVTVSASASDNVGVAGVQFKLDGANINAEDTSSPYSISWDSTNASNATHTLTAVARDAAGNSTTSVGVSVNVNNAPPNQVPLGSLDEINNSGIIRGWSFDPDSSSSIASVKIYIDGPSTSGTLIATVLANVDRPDIRAAYGITGNHGFEYTVPTAYQNGSPHSVYVYGVDLSNSSITPLLGGSGRMFTTRNVILDPEGLPAKVISGKISVLDVNKNLLRDVPFTTNSSGQYLMTLDLPGQLVYFKTAFTPFLTRLMNSINLNGTGSLNVTFPKLLTGDLNQDNIINSIDYSLLNINWFTSNAASDLNKDGLVNSIDFSYMNLHWLNVGEQ